MLEAKGGDKRVLSAELLPPRKTRRSCSIQIAHYAVHQKFCQARNAMFNMLVILSEYFLTEGNATKEQSMDEVRLM